MINESEFSEIAKNLARLDSEREKVIALSRDITRESKHAIYSLHRNDVKKAEEQLKHSDKLVKQMKDIVVKDNELLSVGAYHACLQEYAEGKCYYGFVVERKIPGRKDLNVEDENYLLGIADLTGEMERRAVHSVISGNTEEVKVIWDVVNIIYERFLDFDLRNSELRKKSDSIKWNLKRIEEIMYDLRMKDGPK